MPLAPTPSSAAMNAANNLKSKNGRRAFARVISLALPVALAVGWTIPVCAEPSVGLTGHRPAGPGRRRTSTPGRPTPGRRGETSAHRIEGEADPLLVVTDGGEAQPSEPDRGPWVSLRFRRATPSASIHRRIQ